MYKPISKLNKSHARACVFQEVLSSNNDSIKILNVLSIYFKYRSKGVSSDKLLLYYIDLTCVMSNISQQVKLFK